MITDKLTEMSDKSKTIHYEIQRSSGTDFVKNEENQRNNVNCSCQKFVGNTKNCYLWITKEAFRYSSALLYKYPMVQYQ